MDGAGVSAGSEAAGGSVGVGAGEEAAGNVAPPANDGEEQRYGGVSRSENQGSPEQITKTSKKERFSLTPSEHTRI